MTPERLDQIRTIYRVSRLAAPDAAVTKALEELIWEVEMAQQVAQPGGLTRQVLNDQRELNQYRSRLLDEQRGQRGRSGVMRKTSI